MQLLFRAIITGFGYKIGAELGRLFAEQIGLKKPERKASDERGEDEMPRDLSDDGDEPDDGDETPKVKVV
jgi:hypothetical protein